MTAPITATYRLQLRDEFTFADAVRAVPYFERLGISHLYLSPSFEAVPGSPHGYDVIDPTQLRATLGGRPGFEQLVATARDHGLGVILDIVPNHMAAHHTNAWWWSVLRDGLDSPHAAVFDINWENPIAGSGRVLLPALGDDLLTVIAAGQLEVATRDGEPALRYFEQWFPIAPGTVDPDIHVVLARQHYRLAGWREAPSGSAYRRFFDVDGLVSVRIDDAAVRDATHALILELDGAGLLDGVRVDHVDGLADPTAYLQWLRASLHDDAIIYIEKILSDGELLPDSWPVDGTTGYEAMNRLNDLFVPEAGLAELDVAYLADGGIPFAAVERTSRYAVLEQLFDAEIEMRASELTALLDLDASDITTTATALRALAACFTPYRTYVRRGEHARDEDRAAVALACERAIDAELADPDRLRAAADMWCPTTSATRTTKHEAWIVRWQEITGPIAAKGHEDTALYRHRRLLATNEVGGDPEACLPPTDTTAVDRFHDDARVRADRWPRGMTAVSTHDTKRSGDARARLDVLATQTTAWIEGRRAFADATGLDALDAALVAQLVIAVWPLEVATWDGLDTRVADAVRKSLREAKLQTSWHTPDEPYEDRVLAVVYEQLADRGTRFARVFTGLLEAILRDGASIGFQQLVLRVAGPGVPDTYVGDERWEFSLVDPDNRRAVDLDARASMLAELATLTSTDFDITDSRTKLDALQRLLLTRRRQPDLFVGGAYLPLTVSGPRAHAVTAFARRHGDAWAVAIAAGPADGVAIDEHTTIALPMSAPQQWRAVLDDREITAATGVLTLDAAVGARPAALLLAPAT